ncbi:MAG: nucleotidyl transferase AbiEii/AbiGii toxin family protein [Acidimicrobiia bacterium]|nr:MAG: nucleotidyl transferase AbiEii/AbiGii toxin family protein [Acidimicrobiia bacterium]
MLDNARDEQSEPLFVVKGGSALELRYESKARASRDIDLEFSGTFDEIHGAVVACVETGWSGFGGRVLDPQPLSIPWAFVTGQRLTVQLTYLGRPFAKVPVGVVTKRSPEIDYVHSLRLDPVGFSTPEPIPCLSLPYQVAEKLHACTDPLDGDRTNDRVSDLMDLILIEDLSPDLDLPATRSACVAVFADRSTHPWPPVASFSPQLDRLWANLVTDTGFSIDSLIDAARRVNALIATIERAT